jgi:inhibitor of KinA sporulation pathway (predicted exonuclease)
MEVDRVYARGINRRGRKMQLKNVVSLDLEYNQPSGKIIQIGAAIGDLKTQSIVASFGAIVNPGEPISEFIQTLTGVTQQRVDEEGIDIMAAGAKLFAFVEQHRPFMNPVVWGIGDAESLREEMGLRNERWPFGRRTVDTKTIHVAMCLARGISTKGGLGITMATHYGLDFVGRAHDATVDAENTLKLFFEMQRRYFLVPQS